MIDSAVRSLYNVIEIKRSLYVSSYEGRKGFAMIVNYEFFGREPIENVITCMHFKVDRVVFFGYRDVIEGKRQVTRNFLQKYCGVSEVDFTELPENDLRGILSAMRLKIGYLRSLGAESYFDVTGGESLILVAFGMLSHEFETPIHLYDVENDRLVELEEGAPTSISEHVEKQKVTLDLNRFIELKGGKINPFLQKTAKKSADEEFLNDVRKIWPVAHEYAALWNEFSTLLKKVFSDPNEPASLFADADARSVIASLEGTRIRTPKRLNAILDKLGDAGILLDLLHADGRYRFRFKSSEIRECLMRGGDVLEFSVYQQELEKAPDDCSVGVHLDWDGILHEAAQKDVRNEIDVLSLSGNVPTFISCKSGKMDKDKPLQPLYELDTVAWRFGGKYARKVLVTCEEIGDVYKERAAEMHIELRQMDENGKYQEVR